MAVEYRVCWNASSNITFRGHDDWNPWDDEDATADEVEEALGEVEGGRRYAVPPALEMALEGSGFEWYVETREVSS